MIRTITVVTLLIFSFLIAPLWAKPKKKPTPTPPPAQTAALRFESSTVWTHVKVLLKLFPDKFQVQTTSVSPASGWILKDSKTGQILSKGGIKGQLAFQFEVANPFPGECSFTVLVKSDQEEVPVSFKLSPETGLGATDNTLLADAFKENPDHPYNKTVKSFYEHAVENYLAGDKLSAIKHLRRAHVLDQTQPQVASLLLKLQEKPARDSSSFLDQARADWKNGNREQALAELEDYLNDHPDDEAALKLKKHIETSTGTKRRRKTVEKIEAPAPTPTPIPLMASQDQQAQADEAYNLGLDSYRKGDYTAARKFWEQTIKIQPNHLQAKRNLERLNKDHPATP